MPCPEHMLGNWARIPGAGKPATEKWKGQPARLTTNFEIAPTSVRMVIGSDCGANLLDYHLLNCLILVDVEMSDARQFAHVDVLQCATELRAPVDGRADTGGDVVIDIVVDAP